MSDYKFIKSQKDFCQVKLEIKSRGGINEIKINNEPKEFPVIVTYSLSNTIEGLVANIKHISPEKLLELINE
jgi:hypothetical protein